MMVTFDSLLGRRVVDARGQDVGVVVDVGTGKRSAPRFLLVGPGTAQARPTPIVRVDMVEVVDVTGPAVRLRPLPGEK